jgi:TRAP-type C4-dicarboxylate transport system permease small subunit
MKKFWNIFGWVITIILQIVVCLLLQEIFQRYVFPGQVTRTGEFIIIPLLIWASVVIGVYGIGILSFLIRKTTPLQAGLRFLSSAGLALLPLGLLVFLGLSVGFENQQDFQEIVLDRMVSYYSNLAMVFSFLGFYIPNWVKFVQPKKSNRKK